MQIGFKVRGKRLLKYVQNQPSSTTIVMTYYDFPHGIKPGFSILLVFLKTGLK
jgi:hypothetical protein